jgi:hypothetical protein
LIVLSLLYVCLVLLIRSRYLGVQRGVQLIPGGGLRRFLFFELDMRAFLPCYILLFRLLTLPIPLRVVPVTCPVSCYLLEAIHPSIIHMLFGFIKSALRVVGLLSTFVISVGKVHTLLIDSSN